MIRGVSDGRNLFFIIPFKVGKGRVADGRWEMGDGRWQMGDGRAGDPRGSSKIKV
jgi:hypothetical protein